MKWAFFLAAFVLATAGWFFANPLRGFGVSFNGLTTLDMVPIPAVDFQVRADGSFRRSPKTHDLSLDRLAWIIEDKPEFLLIATGWDGGLKVRPEVTSFLQGYGVRVLKTGEALEAYNELVFDHKRVAIHVHSTD